MTFDWRGHPEFRENNEAVLSARWTDAFSTWDGQISAWAAGIFAGGLLLAAAEFTLAFALLFAACLSLFFSSAEIRQLWLQRLETVQFLGPVTWKTKVRFAVFSSLILSRAFAWLAAFCCVAYLLFEVAA